MGGIDASNGWVVLPLGHHGNHESGEHEQARKAENDPQNPEIDSRHVSIKAMRKIVFI